MGLSAQLQHAALLPAKLEKQASLYESSNDYCKAAKTYVDIITNLVANGCAEAAAEAAAKQSLQVVFKKTGELGLLGRSLLGYQKASSYSNVRASPPQLTADIERLSAGARGLLLEYQLITACSTIAAHQCSVWTIQMIRELVSKLLLLYTVEDYPLRRLRVINRILHLQSCSSASDITEQILKESADEHPLGSLGRDMSLQQYEAQLCASRRVYTMLSSRRVNIASLDFCLDAWWKLLQDCNSLSALETRIDDVAEWLLQLESLLQHLDLHGLEYQRLAVLQLTVRAYEAAHHLPSGGLIAKLNALGVLYIRLGYPGHAGLVLQKGQKLITTVPLSGPNAVLWHLLYAEYFIDIGNNDKRSAFFVIL